MRKLFQAIRQKDLDTVRQILNKNPELISCTAKEPPKKDDGQSPLQVALKTGNFEIADFLLDIGANVNFIEDEACANTWRAPVLHDAINASVMCSRWNTNNPVYGGFKVFSTKEKADQAYRILEKMILLGADVNAKDSYDNSPLWRFCLQARQILPAYNHVEHRVSDNRILTPELREDLSRIFLLLKANGADMNDITSNCTLNIMGMYGEEPLGQILRL